MDIIEHNGENYYVLLPVDDDSDELEYVILRETGEGEEKTLVGIDDEKTILLRGDKFRLIMQQYAASSTESRLIGTMHCRCIYRTLSKHCSGITPIAA